jgi:hypothetical protein
MSLSIYGEGPDPRVEDYLDRVCAPLVGRVQYAERVELRTELRAHLEALIAACGELGVAPEEAVRQALAQFGAPGSVAQAWLRGWERTAPEARASSPLPATWIGMRCFGLATGIGVALLAAVANANEDGATLIAPTLALVPPILAGFATGMRASARHALGAFFALAATIAATVGAATGLSYCITGSVPWNASFDAWRSMVGNLVGLAAIQAVFWLPLGCASAALGGWLQARRDDTPWHGTRIA